MIAFYTNRVERMNQLFLQLDIITTGIDEVSSNTKPLICQMWKLPKSVKKLMEMIPHQEVQSCSWIIDSWHLDWTLWSLYYSSCTWNKGNS
ncbi:unnamed protein product [Camellia sinensis]